MMKGTSTPLHVHKPEFQLQFLRAERFDTAKAALRYCRCLDVLQDFFGASALERELSLSDLNAEETALLRSGQIQLLPGQRDRLGRRVITFVGEVGSDFSHMARMKVATYLVFGVAAKDVTTQKNGLVALFWPNKSMNVQKFMSEPGLQTTSQRFFAAVPIRYSAIHMCFPNESVFYLMKTLLYAMLTKELRRIMRFHNGTQVECLYSLRGFGFPVDHVPLTTSGVVKTKALYKWITFQRAYDQHQQESINLAVANPSAPIAQFPGIECPDMNAIIFRSAGLAFHHSGNIEFRRILERRVSERAELHSMAEKDDHLQGIIEECVSKNLHFVVYDKANAWYTRTKDYDVIRKNVFRSVRDQSKRTKARKASAMQISESGTSGFAALYGKKVKNPRICGGFR